MSHVPSPGTSTCRSFDISNPCVEDPTVTGVRRLKSTANATPASVHGLTNRQVDAEPGSDSPGRIRQGKGATSGAGAPRPGTVRQLPSTRSHPRLSRAVRRLHHAVNSSTDWKRLLEPVSSLSGRYAGLFRVFTSRLVAGLFDHSRSPHPTRYKISSGTLAVRAGGLEGTPGECSKSPAPRNGRSRVPRLRLPVTCCAGTLAPFGRPSADHFGLGRRANKEAGQAGHDW
jgi:hypothetical protein